MRQRLTILLTFVVIIGLLVVLNTLTYVQEEDGHDLELAPNRSTYHSGPTGMRALHDLLKESGYRVIRWRETPAKLLSDSGAQVATFVVIGDTQLPFTDEDAEAVQQWVINGGRFVLIDRQINRELVETYDGWTITAGKSSIPNLNTDPADVSQMTENVAAVKPQQPTVLTRSIESVMPSRFAARFSIARASTEHTGEEEDDDSLKFDREMLDWPSPAPVVHIADKDGALLVDYAFGEGRIVLLSDPYIVSNGGIRLNDNLQLAINTVAGREGLTAFDEYHQGKGITQNAFASYFAGTPALAIAAQVLLVVLLILWTNARRFGRPLPLPHVDRRSSLEFVASMAELQERSRAFDLAIENIYTRTRRVLARHAGVDYNSSRSEIAARIASRSTIDQHKLETLMRQCEGAINGGPINWRQSVDLVRRLREVERDLGLRMRSREVRQAAENI